MIRLEKLSETLKIERMHFTLLLQLLTISTLACAEECTWIKTGRLFETKDGSTIERAQILIRGDRVEAVGSDLAKQAPRCKSLDLSALTVVPGLMDVHTHLLITDRNSGRDFSKELLRISKESDSDRLKQARIFAREMLRAGFTTVRDLGNSGRYLDLTLKKEIAEGKAAGPRLFVSGPGYAVREGQFHSGTPPEIYTREYQGFGDFEAELRSHKNAGADWIKLYADNDPNPGRAIPKDLAAAVRASHRLGLRAAIHASDERSALAAAQAGPDSLEHGYGISAEVLRKMAQARIVLVATDFSLESCAKISQGNPNSLYRNPAEYIQRRAKRLQAAIALGVPIAFGSDYYYDLAGLDRGKGSLESLYSYVEQGMSARDALLSATREGAKLLGQERLGRVAAGSVADLVAVEGDPTRSIRDLSQIVLVMKDGRVICDSKKSCAGF